MIIGIDLDNTLVCSNFLEQICEKEGIKYEPPVDWDFSNYSIEIRKAIFQSFKDPNIMCTFKPFTGAIDTLSQFKKDGHKIIVITARNETIKKETEDYVKRLFPMVDKVIISGEDKTEIFKKEGIEIWIDDSPKGILDAIDLEIITIMISNDKTVYNHFVREKTIWVKTINKCKSYFL